MAIRNTLSPNPEHPRSFRLGLCILVGGRENFDLLEKQP